MLLVADDDPDDQLLIRIAVEEACPADIHLHFVGDGIELLEFLQAGLNGSNKPGLILLDLNMPRKDGREALKDIKSNQRLTDIPTVILTTSSREEDVQYCQSLNVAGYYRKPGSFSELREIVRSLCEEYLKPG